MREVECGKSGPGTQVEYAPIVGMGAMSITVAVTVLVVEATNMVFTSLATTAVSTPG
jgi:Flp pilus assembly pilin Flp